MPRRQQQQGPALAQALGHSRVLLTLLLPRSRALLLLVQQRPEPQETRLVASWLPYGWAAPWDWEGREWLAETPFKNRTDGVKGATPEPAHKVKLKPPRCNGSATAVLKPHDLSTALHFLYGRR